MCGYDPFWLYDRMLEEQYLEDMGLTEQEYYDWRQNEYERNRELKLARNRDAATRDTGNTRQQITKEVTG